MNRRRKQEEDRGAPKAPERPGAKDTEVNKGKSSLFRIGDRVIVHSLVSASHLNGRHGLIINASTVTGRFTVQMESSDDIIAVKPINLYREKSVGKESMRKPKEYYSGATINQKGSAKSASPSGGGNDFAEIVPCTLPPNPTSIEKKVAKSPQAAVPGAAGRRPSIDDGLTSLKQKPRPELCSETAGTARTEQLSSSNYQKKKTVRHDLPPPASSQPPSHYHGEEVKQEEEEVLEEGLFSYNEEISPGAVFVDGDQGSIENGNDERQRIRTPHADDDEEEEAAGAASSSIMPTIAAEVAPDTDAMVANLHAEREELQRRLERLERNQEQQQRGQPIMAESVKIEEPNSTNSISTKKVLVIILCVVVIIVIVAVAVAVTLVVTKRDQDATNQPADLSLPSSESSSPSFQPPGLSSPTSIPALRPTSNPAAPGPISSPSLPSLETSSPVSNPALRPTFNPPAPVPISSERCFETTEELRTAVAAYLQDSSSTTEVAATYGHPIGSWCVSYIEDFSYLFNSNDQQDYFNANAEFFSANLSQWDMSSATDLSHMFRGPRGSSFNGDVSTWDTSRVQNVDYMFKEADSFQGDVSLWDMSSVTSAQSMFSGASSFNSDVSEWDVSSIRNMGSMFSSGTASASSFNADLSRWNVSSVTSMASMFWFVPTFKGSLSSWNVSSVREMNNMFNGASGYNDDISGWDVSSVTNARSMFSLASNFRQYLCPWGSKLPRTANVESMFTSARDCPTQENPSFLASPPGPFCFDCNKPVPTPQPTVESEPGRKCFGNTQELYDAVDAYLEDNSSSTEVARTYGWPIGTWCVSNVDDFSKLFQADENLASFDARNPRAAFFDEELNDWDVSSATTMSSMFEGARAFTRDLDRWDVSKVTSMGNMFGYTDSFNGDISTWNTQSVTWASYMFREAKVFNSDLSSWNTSRLSGMTFMFSGAKAFNSNISSWDTSHVTGMIRVFSGAESFNQDISRWTVSSLTALGSSFRGCSSFRQNLCPWGPQLKKDIYISDDFAGTNCPVQTEIVLEASPPGPFCFACT